MLAQTLLKYHENMLEGVPLIRTILATLVTLAVLAGTGYPATFYVSTSGNDAWPGTLAQPWRTLQFAADQAGAGDTVIVQAGTYLGFRAKSSGADGSPVTFRASEGAAVVLNAPGPQNWHGSVINVEGYDWWVLEGLEVTGATAAAGIDIREANHVTVRDCFCHHNRKWGIFTGFAEYFTAEDNECSYSTDEHGIYHSNSGDHAVIRFNYCHHNRSSGIQINADPSMGGDGISSFCVGDSNVRAANGAGGAAGVNLASVRDSQITNNLFHGNLAGGIAMWDDGQGEEWGCRNNLIAHNTIHMPTGSRWTINMINGSSGNRIFNNILMHDGGKAGLETDTSSLTGLQMDYNLLTRVSLDDAWLTLAEWQSGYGRDLHSATRTPAETFAVPGSDYHLLASAWAVDSGTTLVEVALDLEGSARPQGTASDLGCYEYLSAPVPGDLDGDGQAGPADALILAHYLAGNPVDFPVTPAVADLDGDGAVTVVDLLELFLM